MKPITLLPVFALLAAAALPAQDILGGLVPTPKVNCDKPGKVNAICYARQIQELLTAYTERLSAEVKQRREQYSQTAKSVDSGIRDRTDSNLKLERGRRADLVTNQLLDSPAAAWTWKTALYNYMLADRERTAALLAADLEHGAASQFLDGIDPLREDVDKARKLAGLVALLAEPRNLRDELSQWLAYGKETRDKYQELSCAAVKKEKATADAELTAANTALTAAKAEQPPDADKIAQAAAKAGQLKGRSDALAGYLTAKKCPAQ